MRNIVLITQVLLLLLVVAQCHPTVTQVLRGLDKNERNGKESSIPSAQPFSTKIGTITIQQTHYFFSQILDHFNPANTNMWDQRITVFNQYFNPINGTVFILIGGEGEEAGLSNGIGWLVNLCQKFSGMVIAVEHRFYGVSQPFGYSDTSYSTANLDYLTVDQSLADLANLIVQVKLNKLFDASQQNPFITIGGSYPGAMSAWFRYKYPHLTVGALASSAVVNAIIDFQKYDYQIFKSTSLSGEWCPQNIQHFNQVIEQSLQVGGTLADNIKTMFNATKLSDVEFLNYFADYWAGMVQYGKRTMLCNMFKPDNFSDQLKNVVAYAAANMTVKGYNTDSLKITSYDNTSAGRQWTWQVCSMFGWFQTANHLEPMRNPKVNLQFSEKTCKEVFGDNFVVPEAATTNIMYGGNELEATNIVFTNGVEDEWQWASIRSPQNGMDAIISDCTDCGHCVEFRTPKTTDSLALQQTRQQVENLFAQWTSEHLGQEMLQQRNNQPSFSENNMYIKQMLKPSI